VHAAGRKTAAGLSGRFPFLSAAGQGEGSDVRLWTKVDGVKERIASAYHGAKMQDAKFKMQDVQMQDG
jgi:hypothetical protein